MINEESDLYFELMHKLENLAEEFLKGDLKTYTDLWKFENALLDFQIDLQERRKVQQQNKAEIPLQKAAIVYTQEGWEDEINLLKTKFERIESEVSIFNYIYDLSRQLGDAFAWKLLGEDELFIRPLSENQPNPSIPEKVSLLGILETARHFANSGAGFPIIHDITNCLRIGDITFVSQDHPFTVEVKTSENVISEIEVENHVQRTSNISVRVYGSGSALDKFEAFSKYVRANASKENQEKPFQNRSRLNDIDKRLGRQLERMSKAEELQYASSSKESVEIDGIEHVFIKTVLSEKPSHWKTIQNLSLEAKAKGFATTAVENGIYYTAIYTVERSKISLNVDIDDALPWKQLEEDWKLNIAKIGNVLGNFLATDINLDYLPS